MVEYLASNELIHPNHHAYRKHHNTTTALIQLYDVWLESLENGELGGVCFLDMSAAFDIVDHSLLLKKLELYGFDRDMVSWTSSYLSGRSQSVCIDGNLSKLLPVVHGVPQGSILGPLLYTLFTNELPDVIQDPSQHIPGQTSGSTWPPYSMGCRCCGTVGCYADDTTYSYSDSDPEQLSLKMSSQYKVLSDFLVSNRLKLNDDKTHLMVLSTSQARLRRNRRDEASVQITTPTEIIEQSEFEKLLGTWLHQDMKWAENIMDNNESLVKSLSSRVGALKKLSKVASFKNRIMIANGIFMSKLLYLIPLWGGCAQYLIRSLQVLQNKAARAVTKLDWYTPTSELLKQVGWLSVHQLSVYHSVVLVFKVLQAKTPKYLYSMFSSSYGYNTREANSGRIKHTRGPELEIARDSFRWRSADLYNLLPADIRTSSSLQLFKLAAKVWIQKNIEIS